MIRVTRLTDYGIVLLSRFAQEEVGTVHSARELSSDSGIPLPTVSKILKALTRGGILLSQRGTQGGYRLSRPPTEISVATVVEALEGPIALTECSTVDSTDCGIEMSCPVRTNWQQITDAIRKALEDVSLDSMHMEFPLHHEPAQPESPPSPGA